MTPEEREVAIQAHVDYLTGVIVYDAENCTSYKEEIADLLRRGCPRLDNLTDDEVRSLRTQGDDDEERVEEARCRCEDFAAQLLAIGDLDGLQRAFGTRDPGFSLDDFDDEEVLEIFREYVEDKMPTRDPPRPGTRVKVYWNSRSRTFSVLPTRRGASGPYAAGYVFLEAVRLVVQPAGRALYLRTGRRTIHAFVVGRLVACRHRPVPVDRATRARRAVRYNPATDSSFIWTATGAALGAAARVVLTVRQRHPVGLAYGPWEE